MSSPTTQALQRVHALSPTNAWAVGANVTLHWDGTAWSVVSQPISGATFNNLRAASATDIWAAGGSGAIIHWDGTAWSKFDAPYSDTTGDPHALRLSYAPNP